MGHALSAYIPAKNPAIFVELNAKIALINVGISCTCESDGVFSISEGCWSRIVLVHILQVVDLIELSDFIFS